MGSFGIQGSLSNTGLTLRECAILGCAPRHPTVECDS